MEETRDIIAEAIQMTDTWVKRDLIRELLIVASFACGMRALFLSAQTQTVG